jgi:predicted DNA-binding transcriptional regulator YafY
LRLRPPKTALPSPRLPASRPPLERMLRIHQLVQSGSFPNATRLAAELEVSTKSIHRDLEFMRDRLQLPLEFDRARFGYFYTEQVSAFPTVQITEGELFALIVAERALQQYRGTSFEKPLLSAIKKMEQSLSQTISLDLGDVERAISFRTSAEPILDLNIFDRLAKAAANREQLELTYRKPGLQRLEHRIVDPYHLANINGEWFLFAYDHLRNDIRTFVPSRIKSVRATGNCFAPGKKFSLDERLRHSFGVHSGRGTYQVVLRFDSRVADYIREKKWHESQVLKDLPNGGVELRMKLSGLQEVERWVLGWAGTAKVLAPRELAESVQASARRILGAV